MGVCQSDNASKEPTTTSRLDRKERRAAYQQSRIRILLVFLLTKHTRYHLMQLSGNYLPEHCFRVQNKAADGTMSLEMLHDAFTAAYSIRRCYKSRGPWIWDCICYSTSLSARLVNASHRQRIAIEQAPSAIVCCRAQSSL